MNNKLAIAILIIAALDVFQAVLRNADQAKANLQYNIASPETINLYAQCKLSNQQELYSNSTLTSRPCAEPLALTNIIASLAVKSFDDLGLALPMRTISYCLMDNQKKCNDEISTLKWLFHFTAKP